MSSSADGIPAALLHNLKHNQVVHERVLILTVKVEGVPHVDADNRVETRTSAAASIASSSIMASWKRSTFRAI